jgi:WD40 repeat protein
LVHRSFTKDYINCCQSFFSTQKVLTGGSDRAIKEWDIENLKLTKNVSFLLTQYSCISTCSALGVAYDDANFISGHLDGTLKIWTVGNDKPDNVIDAHDDRINYIEIVKNENQVLTSSKYFNSKNRDYSVKLWDLRKMASIYTVGDDKFANYCESSLSISSDKKYFSIGSSKGEIYTFNVQNGELVEKFDNKSPASITSLCWRPYHSQLYVGDANGIISVWTN